eukprot:gene11327-15191_t
MSFQLYRLIPYKCIIFIFILVNIIIFYEFLNILSNSDNKLNQFDVNGASNIYDDQLVTIKKYNNITSSNYNQNVFVKKGILICDGKSVDSEVIYWKIVPGDNEYKSPLGLRSSLSDKISGDQYLTLDYDHGGWNNMRMAIECAIVLAHAMNRTFVAPPLEHIYLLTKTDQKDASPVDRDGYDEFYDINLLKSHKGFQSMRMEEFLKKEAITGQLNGHFLPENATHIWGRMLWGYLVGVADASPTWFNKYVAFSKYSDDHNLSRVINEDHNVIGRMKRFADGREVAYYEESLQKKKHLHFRGIKLWRLLHHPYALVFFADPWMQSYYKRFVRDYIRYKDEIQCAADELLRAVRRDARLLAPHDNGDFYAIHVRRGDLEFEKVKISSPEIVENLRYVNGTPMIPYGSMVYISTDDPKGICEGCNYRTVNCSLPCDPLVDCTRNKCKLIKIPCENLTSPKPLGCPEETSWDSFIRAGWKIRFLDDYLKEGIINQMKYNTYGMIESIVSSRAKLFAGTYGSTFSGYIHRLRGYHGLGEQTFYHFKEKVFALQSEQSFGGQHAWNREWRAGWTDDEFGQLI